MRGAVQRLKPGGILLIQALSYYGIHRIEEMCRELPALCHEGIAATSEWVPLWTSEESKKLLRNQLKGYANEEARGGSRYFCHPVEGNNSELLTATETMETVVENGQVPLAMWQCHKFTVRAK